MSSAVVVASRHSSRRNTLFVRRSEDAVALTQLSQRYLPRGCRSRSSAKGATTDPNRSETEAAPTLICRSSRQIAPKAPTLQMTKLTPTALWAQRSDRVLLTLDVQDCANPIIKFDNDGVTETGTLEFSGTTSDGKEYELKLIMSKAIKPDDCKVSRVDTSSQPIPLLLWTSTHPFFLLLYHQITPFLSYCSISGFSRLALFRSLPR